MKLIRGKKNETQLDYLNREALKKCDAVWAAVAYVNDEKSLILPCYESNIPLKLWARYDYSSPVNASILEWFIGKSPRAICKLVPDIFHPKIIWWKSYGVYIGSANLTDSAWFRNFEAGVFVTEDELKKSNMRTDLIEFFADIDEASTLLTKEHAEQIEKHQSSQYFRDQESCRKQFEKERLIPHIASLAAIPKRKGAGERKKAVFLKEWNQTLQYMRDIATRVSEEQYRPKWVSPETKGMSRQLLKFSKLISTK